MIKFCSHNNKPCAAEMPGREKRGKKGAKENMSDGKRGEKIPLPSLAFSAGFTCIILFSFPFLACLISALFMACLRGLYLLLLFHSTIK